MEAGKQACGNSALRPCRTKVPRHAFSIPLLTLHQGADSDAEYHSRPHAHRSIIPEGAILAKNYDENALRADLDPHCIFCSLVDAPASPTKGLVGPLSSLTFSPPAVERVPKMEGCGGRRAGAASGLTRQTQYKVLQNVIKSLLNAKDHVMGPGSSWAVGPGAAARKAGTSMGPRTSGNGGGAGEVVRRQAWDSGRVCEMRLFRGPSRCTTGRA
jgi:hypothetical protein